MIQAVGAVARTDAVAMAFAAGASARQTLERRQKRLRWLGALREALGEAGPLVDAIAEDGGEEAALAETRARIDAALGTIEEMRGLMGGASEAGAIHPSAGTITAADLARRIGADAERSLRTQARLGVASVRRLVGDEGNPDSVNGL